MSCPKSEAADAVIDAWLSMSQRDRLAIAREIVAVTCGENALAFRRALMTLSQLHEQENEEAARQGG